MLKFGMKGFLSLLESLKINKDEDLLKILSVLLREKEKFLSYAFLKKMIEGLDELLPIYFTKLTKTCIDFLRNLRRIRNKLKLDKLKTDEIELELINKALESNNKELGLIGFRELCADLRELPWTERLKSFYASYFKKEKILEKIFIDCQGKHLDQYKH